MAARGRPSQRARWPRKRIRDADCLVALGVRSVSAVTHDLRQGTLGHRDLEPLDRSDGRLGQEVKPDRRGVVGQGYPAAVDEDQGLGDDAIAVK